MENQTKAKILQNSAATVLVALMILAAPVLGAGSVGVHANDWIQYGNVSASWSGTGTPPYNLPALDQIQWLKATVQSVSGNTVTATGLIHYSNGTETSKTITGDISAGTGNISFFIIP